MARVAQNLVVVGGGIMGGDIAFLFAAAGWAVEVVSPSQKTRDALPARIDAAMTMADLSADAMGRVSTHARLEDIDWAPVDLVVEAATEDLALKQQLFAADRGAGRRGRAARDQHLEFPDRRGRQDC